MTAYRSCIGSRGALDLFRWAWRGGKGGPLAGWRGGGGIGNHFLGLHLFGRSRSRGRGSDHRDHLQNRSSLRLGNTLLNGRSSSRRRRCRFHWYTLASGFLYTMYLRTLFGFEVLHSFLGGLGLAESRRANKFTRLFVEMSLNFIDGFVALVGVIGR